MNGDRNEASALRLQSSTPNAHDDKSGLLNDSPEISCVKFIMGVGLETFSHLSSSYFSLINKTGKPSAKKERNTTTNQGSETKQTGENFLRHSMISEDGVHFGPRYT